MSTGEIPFLDTAGFVGGPVVQEFERDFAEFCESKFCVGMGAARMHGYHLEAS
jgi:dTDP-4-amino-4,6-dideoxygalactose transaminase